MFEVNVPNKAVGEAVEVIDKVEEPGVESPVEAEKPVEVEKPTRGGKEGPPGAAEVVECSR